MGILSDAISNIGKAIGDLISSGTSSTRRRTGSNGISLREAASGQSPVSGKSKGSTISSAQGIRSTYGGTGYGRSATGQKQSTYRVNSNTRKGSGSGRSSSTTGGSKSGQATTTHINTGDNEKDEAIDSFNSLSDSEQAAVMDSDAAKTGNFETDYGTYSNDNLNGMGLYDFQFGGGYGVDWDYANQNYDTLDEAMAYLEGTDEYKQWMEAWRSALTSEDSILRDYYADELASWDGDFDAMWHSWMYGDEDRGLLAHTVDNLMTDAATAYYISGGDEWAMDQALRGAYNEQLGYVTDDEGNQLYDEDGEPMRESYLIDVMDAEGYDDDYIDNISAIVNTDEDAFVDAMEELIMQNVLNQAYRQENYGETSATTDTYYDIYDKLKSEISADELNEYLSTGNMEYGWGDGYSTDIRDYDPESTYSMSIDPDVWDATLSTGNTTYTDQGMGTGKNNTRLYATWLLGNGAGYKESDLAAENWASASEG